MNMPELGSFVSVFMDTYTKIIRKMKSESLQVYYRVGTPICLLHLHPQIAMRSIVLARSFLIQTTERINVMNDE